MYFTNRAQVRIKMEDWNGAVEDCKAAIKLKVDSVKAQVTAGRDGQLSKPWVA